MNVDLVKVRVQRIKDAVGDYEIAHGMEDQLFADVLTAIAHGQCEDPKMCAAEALKTLELDFARHCA